MTRLTVRIDFDDDRQIEPGKIKLLELVNSSGSISAAARQMGMSYRTAWLLVDALNRCFREPLGGGADRRCEGWRRGADAVRARRGRVLPVH
jgi:molybdate transport system regulatory protein